MAKEPLGALERVNPRDYWEREDVDFTQWLAEEANMELLADTLGLELEVESVETNVGSFRADIICRNVGEQSLVVIENQLERADHDHLGKLFTYAAGLEDVKTLIWIVTELRPEHRAALDWLNRITHEDFNFFGIEIELWRIGTSAPAPKFNVVVQPNDWSKIVQEAAAAADWGELSEGKQLQLDFWKSLGDYIKSVGSKVKPPKPSPENWKGYGIGRTGAHVILVVNKAAIGVSLEIERRVHPTWYSTLFDSGQDIEEELGFKLEWIDEDGKKFSHLRRFREVDLSDKARWPELHAWMIDTLDKMREVLRPRVQLLTDDNIDDIEVG